MSLSGNLATFSLDEVLLLLGRTAKSGALRVRDATTEGVVYFTAGRLCGAEVDQVSGAVEDVTALEARLVDACFALARLDEGAFEFETDRRPPWAAADEVEVGPVVERIRDVLGCWPAIERHVPGLDVTPSLVEVLARDAVTIDRAAWPVLVAVDGRASVRAIGATLGRSALEVAAALAGLVEAGAVTVGTAAGSPAVEPAASTAAWSGHGIQVAAIDVSPGAGITDLEAQVSALEHAAGLDPAPVVEVDDASEAVPDARGDVRGGDDDRDGGAAASDDEPVEGGFPVSEGVSMLTHDPDALALLNRAELERAALGEPIEEPDAEPEPEPVAGADLLDEAGRVPEPRPAVVRDRGALLRMFSSLRDG